MSNDLLAEIVRLRTYAAKLPDGTKETHDQTVERCIAMHVKKFPQFEVNIREAFEFVKNKKVVPSMRSLQFAGPAIEKTNERIYNCSFLNIEAFKDFADTLYLLACGCGVGYSVQDRHVSQLPEIGLGSPNLMIIGDSKESWADSVLELLNNVQMSFDYSRIRPNGATLSGGGTASGPDCLIECHAQMRNILFSARGRRLTPTEVSDLICHIATCIVSGGVRRSALICLFDANDASMLSYKSGKWWETHPQRGKANVSAVLHRKDMEFKTKFNDIMDRCYSSGSGEPGIALTNNYDIGGNPCFEIALNNKGLCNLTEVNVAAVKDAEDLIDCVVAATFIGTLQATYTDFNYISPLFKKNCDEEALLGVSFTGQAENWEILNEVNLRIASITAKEVNENWSAHLGINPAARIGCVKPSGSTSAVLGTTSGIHAAFAPFYLRRVRVAKNDPISKFMVENAPELVEPDAFDSYSNVVTVPVKKTGAVQRSVETAVETLERMKHINLHWVHATHRSGDNKHNVSLTVNYHEHEKEDIKKWMLENSDIYSGISLLPFDGGSYQQLPFEEITEEVYNEWCLKVPTDLDLSKINYGNRIDERAGESACGGGSCEIR